MDSGHMSGGIYLWTRVCLEVYTSGHVSGGIYLWTRVCLEVYIIYVNTNTACLVQDSKKIFLL